MTCPCNLNRRRLLGGLAALPALGGLGACSENAATGRSQFVVIGDDQMAILAARNWADLKRSTPVSDDADDRRRVATVGRRIADVSGLDGVDWEFVAFDSPEANAFVLPGGKVGVYRGLLEQARDDDELAAVIGHEVGHVAARHSAERLSQQLASQAAIGLVAAAVSGSSDYGEYADEVAAALGVGVTVGVILPYSRRHELEADDVGVRLADQAAYDPNGAVRFWTRRIAESRATAAPPEFLSTHPADSERLERLRRAAAALA